MVRSKKTRKLRKSRKIRTRKGGKFPRNNKNNAGNGNNQGNGYYNQGNGYNIENLNIGEESDLNMVEFYADNLNDRINAIPDDENKEKIRDILKGWFYGNFHGFLKLRPKNTIGSFLDSVMYDAKKYLHINIKGSGVDLRQAQYVELINDAYRLYLQIKYIKEKYIMAPNNYGRIPDIYGMAREIIMDKDLSN